MKSGTYRRFLLRRKWTAHPVTPTNASVALLRPGTEYSMGEITKALLARGRKIGKRSEQK
jgi:hypothetical protein